MAQASSAVVVVEQKVVLMALFGIDLYIVDFQTLASAEIVVAVVGSQNSGLLAHLIPNLLPPQDVA